MKYRIKLDEIPDKAGMKYRIKLDEIPDKAG